MKKRLAILSVVSLLTAASLASCGEGYDYKDGIMLYINGVPYTTDELFQSYGLDSQAGVKAYYSILDNVVVEATIQKTQSMTQTVEKKMQDFKDTAASSAKTNGTTVSEEIEKALTADKFDSLEQLQNSYYLSEKQTKASDDYYSDTNYENSFIPKYIEDDSPYHVRHILVKFDSSDTSNLYQGTISSSDAKNISNVVERLATGETFGSVALTKSQDSSSAENFGDAGIMSTKTSFVSEFKYGLYTYDAFFNPQISDLNKAAVIDKTFSSDASNVAAYSSMVRNNAFGIPYSMVKALDYYSEKETDKDGQSVKYAEAYNYPRNVIFDNYFNNHGLSFIYLDQPTAGESAYYTDSDYQAALSANRFQTVSGVSNKLEQYTGDSSTYLTKTATISGSQPILCDETGKPIIVTRAGSGSSDSGYQGIHFIIEQNDPFTDISDPTLYQTKTDELAAYYTLEKPSTTTGTGTTGNTYVSFINTTDRSVYTTRAKAIKTAVKASDSNFDYRMFDYYLNEAETGNNPNGIKIVIPDDIRNAVTTYIDSQIATTDESNQRSYNTSWQSFLELLQVSEDYSSRIIPVQQGIDNFLNNTLDSFNNTRAGNSGSGSGN